MKRPVSSVATEKRARKRSRKASKSKALTEMPALYTEDLGAEGTKEVRNNSYQAANTFRVPLTLQELGRRQDRETRFRSNRKATTIPLYQPVSVSPNKDDRSSLVDARLVGENQSLEKNYLRLTTFPKKEDVRPFEVLIKSLAHIKRRYIQDEDFEWANDQLKSVRQDLTVQRIRNRFVLEVYETHARILLENGDLNEFNQCQTVIRNFSDGFGEIYDPLSEIEQHDMEFDHSLVKMEPLHQLPSVEDEFAAYGLLYSIVQGSWLELRHDLLRIEKYLVDDKDHEAHQTSCMHAFQVAKAVINHDSRAFFRLYTSAPHLSAYLMDFLVNRVRKEAFKRIISAYRPNVCVEHFRDSLQFQDLEETREFLRQNGAIFIKEASESEFWVDCKASASKE